MTTRGDASATSDASPVAVKSGDSGTMTAPIFAQAQYAPRSRSEFGSTVATRKDAKLEGTKLLVVAETDPDGAEREELHVAADAIGAGAGDLVLVTIGSAARLTAATRGLPLDALVVAIVDTVEHGGERVYDATGAA